MRCLGRAPPASRRNGSFLDITSGFGGSPDMADYAPRLVYDANDPTATWAAQDFRSAKALFVPSVKRDIVPFIACTQPPAGGVAWQPTSDGENSY